MFNIQHPDDWAAYEEEYEEYRRLQEQIEYEAMMDEYFAMLQLKESGNIELGIGYVIGQTPKELSPAEQENTGGLDGNEAASFQGR